MEAEEEELSESGMNPPAYTPPEIPDGLLPVETVVVTEPTPEIEHAQPKEVEGGGSSNIPSNVPTNSFMLVIIWQKSQNLKIILESESHATEKSNFEMELNSDQQQKYQTQFDEQNAQNETIILVTEIPGELNLSGWVRKRN